MKRVFDLAGALAGLLLLAPVFAVVAWIIRRERGGPVFYRQTRIGQHGRPFRIWKFRTMVVNADQIGPSLTAGHDPRITRIGRWLRKFKLDELPQLLNVVAGEMSFVGPRPEVAEYVAHYSAAQREILNLKPGITDPASLEYFGESELLASAADPHQTYLDEIMPAKLEINRRYAERASVMADAVIIARTLLRIAGIRTGHSSPRPNVPNTSTPSRAA